MIWDVSFWELYEHFCKAFFSIYSIKLQKIPKVFESKHITATNHYFYNKIIDYLLKRHSTYKATCNILKNHKRQNACLYDISEFNFTINTLCDLGKEYILLHEFEHILYYYSPETYKTDTIIFDDVIRTYKKEIIPNLDPNSIRNRKKELEAEIDLIQNTKNGNAYKELYYDFHAFNELLWHNGENLTNYNEPFAPYSYKYVFAVKMLKMFESCLRFITQIIETAASTRALSIEYRNALLAETNREGLREIFRRDYLLVELCVTHLYILAQEMHADIDIFLENHNTIPMVEPYTEVLEPAINYLINELTYDIVNNA